MLDFHIYFIFSIGSTAYKNVIISSELAMGNKNNGKNDDFQKMIT